MSSYNVSNGNQVKWWDGEYLIKLDTPGCYESISEVLCSTLQSCIVNSLPYVDYTLYEYEGYLGCKCKSFLQEGESVVSLKKLLDSTGLYIDYSLSGSELKDVIVGVINMEYMVNIEEYLGYVLWLDAIVLNCDRHLRNISFIKGLNGKYRVSPVYDFGDSLGSRIDRHEFKSQPFCSDFLEQSRLFERELIIIDYNKLERILKDALESPRLYIMNGKESYLNRGIRFLLKRLNDTENILWRRLNP